MNKIYSILILITTLMYSTDNDIKHVNIVGVFKVTKHNCLKGLNNNAVCQDVTLYEFRNNQENNQSIFINWKSDYVDKFKLYYNAIYFNMDKLNKGLYPFTIVLSDGLKDNYIETVQFMDKNHGVKRAGFKRGLVEEVYFERITEEELKKYNRLYPLSKKPIYHKNHISKSYFERILKEKLPINQKNFKYNMNNTLSKEDFFKLYGIKM